MRDELREKCGVFGFFGAGHDAARVTFFGLFALQHRGQEGSGICASDGTTLSCHKGAGLVSQVYTEEDMQRLPGHIALGHNRYSTSRGVTDHTLAEVQPFMSRSGKLALAHNGNLPSVVALQTFLKEKGVDADGSNDSKLMHLAIEYYLDQGLSLPEAVERAYPLFTGAFSLLVMDRTTLIAVRDACGMRPLSMGKLDGAYVFASETCALETVGVEVYWDVGPGEMLVVTEKGATQKQLAPPTPKFDVFEFVYFARPDSVLLDRSVYQVRWDLGKELAEEAPIEADIVVPVPETAIPSAIGYAKCTGVPLEMALCKNRYIHRTFIEPDQHTREQGVGLKLTPQRSLLFGKRVILIDDSIVRGTTSKQIIKLLFDAGAREVHFLVASPPVRFPDFYGIDTPEQRYLIGAQHSVPDIERFLGATSLHYLSVDGLVRATGVPRSTLSLSAFTGEYPIDIGERRAEVSYDVFHEDTPSSSRE